MRRYSYVNMHTLNADIFNFITQTAMGIKYHIGPDTIIIGDLTLRQAIQMKTQKPADLNCIINQLRDTLRIFYPKLNNAQFQQPSQVIFSK